MEIHPKKYSMALVGFMGCGKSTIGKLVSDNISIPFADTDTIIEKDMGMSVNDIFEKYGEDYFRKFERNLCKIIALESPLVIAAGGGIIKSETNIENLKKSGVIIYLKSTPEKIYGNISRDNSRPLLANAHDKLEKIKELLYERLPLYESCADYTIDISSMKIEESAQEISKIYRRINKLKNF